MGFSIENAQQWLGNIRNGGALPKVDFALLNASIANAGNVTKGIDLDSQTPEQLEALAIHSVETAPFADKAQSKEMLKAYIQDDLIPNSYEIDEEKGLEKGTSLRKFFDDTRTATKGVNFEEFKQNPMAYMMQQDKSEVERITTEIRGSAHENIKHDILSKDGKEGKRTIEQDFVHSIKTKADENGESIYKDAKADDPKPLGGGMMEMIMAFIGMLLGVNLGNLFGGQAPSNQSLQEREQDQSPATPEQQNTMGTIDKGMKFAAILKDNAITGREYAGMGIPKTLTQAGITADLSDHVILTPNAEGDNPGDTVVYARKNARGELSDIQVATTDVNGETTVKTVEGNFRLDGSNNKEVGAAIAQEAERTGTTVDKNNPNIQADDIKSGISAAVQRMQEQGAGR